MQLLLMRHGEAEPYSTNDQSRQLTAHGVVQAEYAGEWLQRKFGSVDLALVSPFIRAQQTYAAVSQKITVKTKQDSTDIVPSGRPEVVHDYVDVLLQERQAVQSLILVCHMPIVSFLVDQFCQQHMSTMFATSAIAHIEYDVAASKGRIVELYKPRL